LTKNIRNVRTLKNFCGNYNNLINNTITRHSIAFSGLAIIFSGNGEQKACINGYLQDIDFFLDMNLTCYIFLVITPNSGIKIALIYHT